MSDPNYIILYVTNPATSVSFYAELLGKNPVANSPNFAMFALESGVMFGLWAKHDVKPDTAKAVGGAELAFTVADNDAVDATYTDWLNKKLTITQAPTHMDFGYTLVALDPDGHRLRVFAPSAS